MRWRNLNRHASELDDLARLPAHELLGLSDTAPEADIKAAYRRKARAYHPDFVDPFLRHHGEEVMKLLNRAYDVMLSKRRS
jgi:DnaJ-class molecular chaperone